MTAMLTPNWAVRNYITANDSGFAMGTSGNDDIFATGNDQALYGEGGDDIFMGGAGADWLMGGAGDDILDGGSGANAMDGGSGSDRFIITAGNGIQDIQNFQTGPGGDVVDLHNYGFTSFDQVRAAMTVDTSGDGTPLGTLLNLPNGDSVTFNGFDLSHPFT